MEGAVQFKEWRSGLTNIITNKIEGHEKDFRISGNSWIDALGQLC